MRISEQSTRQGLITAKPDSRSMNFCKGVGLTMRTTSHVGRMWASSRWPPCAVPSFLPITACACTTGFPSLRATSPMTDRSSPGGRGTCDELSLRRDHGMRRKTFHGPGGASPRPDPAPSPERNNSHGVHRPRACLSHHSLGGPSTRRCTVGKADRRFCAR